MRKNRKYYQDQKVIIAEIEKSPIEILRVERKRLNGHELISLKVFSCKQDGTKKGISLHLNQWREVLPMIQQGLQIQFSDEPPKPPVKLKLTRPNQERGINERRKQ